jgi:hypothetical protein
MKRITAIVAAMLMATAATPALAWYTGPGLYIHNGNGLLKVFASSFNGNAWSLYVPPVVPPVVVPPVTPPVTPPVVTPTPTPVSTPAAAPAPQQPAQNVASKTRPAYAAYVMIGIMAQYTLWVVCEKENIEWCKAPAWIRGPMTAPTPGEYTAHPFYN